MNKEAIILTDEPVKAKRGKKSNGARNGQPVTGTGAGNGHAKPAKPDPRNPLNDLTSTEWLPETISVWTQRGLGAGHADAQIERQHPAPFSFTDVSRLVRFFTKRGGVVPAPSEDRPPARGASTTEGGGARVGGRGRLRVEKSLGEGAEKK